MRSLATPFLVAALLVAAACNTPSSAPPAAKPAATAPAASGAASPPAAAGAAAVPTQPAQLQRIDVPLAAISAQDAPLWLGVDQGYFARYGLDVNVIDMAPATASQALSAGSAPIGMTGGS